MKKTTTQLTYSKSAFPEINQTRTQPSPFHSPECNSVVHRREKTLPSFPLFSLSYTTISEIQRTVEIHAKKTLDNYVPFFSSQIIEMKLPSVRTFS